MKIKKICGLFVTGALLLGLAACAVEQPEPTVASLELELDKAAIELTIGESYTAGTVVVVEEMPLEDASLQWLSSDEKVATVADGVITAQGAGTATISALCQYGGREAIDTIRVTVTKPTVLLDVETPVILDLNEADGGLVAFTLPDGVTKSDYVMLGDAEYRMLSQGNTMLIDATYLAPGEYIMTVEQEKQILSFPACVATVVIKSAEDLKAATQREDAKTGYFMLANNIDCSALTEPICFEDYSWFETNLGNNREGFRGGFNGMGYTIYNLKLPTNGLFGSIAACGVVRNVAFVNVQAEEYVLCKDTAGLISQIYVQGDFSRVLFHSYGPTNRLENIVAEATRSGAMISQHVASVDTEGYNVVDLYALLIVGRDSLATGYSRTSAAKYLEADASLCAYAGATRKSIPTITEENGFNSYWDISSGFPVFISSIE